MKIGIFGGTFNPIHKGHLKMAEYLLENKLLEQVIFVPAAVPPLKNHSIVSYDLRASMVKLAIKNKQGLNISEVENILPKPSYSIRTMKFLKKQYFEDTLYFIIGADNLKNIHKWSHYEEFIKDNNFIIVKRDNKSIPEQSQTELSNELYKKLTAETIDTPLINISSTEIRTKGAENFKEFIPAKVLNFIKEKSLYAVKHEDTIND